MKVSKAVQRGRVPDNAPKLMHYFMGFLSVVPNEGPATDLNVLLELETPRLPRSALFELHTQTLQRYVKEHGASGVKVKDILIKNISYLGAMTPEEFHAPSPHESKLKDPAGSKEEEVTQ